MPKVSPVQNSFIYGEASPRVHGRFDAKFYPHSAKTLENILIHQAGGGSRRPGSKYVAEVETSSEKTRLITFEFSTTQTYIIEVGNLYMRFYRNNGQIQTTTMAITGATQANPCVLTMVDHPFADGDEITITGVVGMTELNGNTYTVANRTDDTVELSGVNSTAYGAYVSGGTATRTGACEIITPYTTAQLFDLQFAQDADTMWIVHPSHKPQKLTRASHTSWIISDYAPADDPFTAADAYPSCVAMFEQRIYFANTNDDPQKIWASKSGDFETMTVGVNAGDPFVYVIATDKVNAIRWLKPSSKSIQIGTLGGTFSMSSGSDALAITPTNVSVKLDTTYGAANILPEAIGGFIYYVGRDLTHLRELGYSLDREAQEALNMTKIADHIAKAADPLDDDGFTQIAYQQSPVSRLWCVRNDGQLAVFTREIEDEIMGWSRQISGSDLRGNGKYESVAVIPTDGGDDEVWVIVQRYINGSTVRYIEYFMPEEFDHQQDIFFVDSGLSLDSPKTITDITVKTPIDDMEYASDPAAQAAYVSSEASSIEAQADGTHGLAFGDSGDTEYREAQSFTLSAAMRIEKVSIKFNANANNPVGNTVCRIETDSGGLPSGTLAHANLTKTVADPPASQWNDYEFATPVTLEAGTYWIVMLCDDQATTNYWQLDRNIANPYAGGNLAISDDGGSSWTAHSDSDLAFKLYVTTLQCFSEDTIIQQGSYSLKVIARQTNSLNDTLTRTLATSIDLSGVNSIKLNVRASRTGSNFKIGFHDSGGVTTEHTISVAAADTDQVETIDISGVANADKDDIDSIIITILNADANNTFYIDNIYAPAAYITVTAIAHGFVDGDRIRIVDVVGTTELNNKNFVVDKLTADTFALKDEGGSYIDGTTYTAYISGGEARKRVTTITGLTHLVGEEVAIAADGEAVTSKIVSAAGEITLDARASIVHAGLPYISDIELLPHPEGSATGMAVGKVQRIYKLIIKFYRSLGVQFGPDEDNLDTIEETTLFTGDRIRAFPGDWDREAKVLLRQAQPLPLNILSVTSIVEVVEE